MNGSARSKLTTLWQAALFILICQAAGLVGVLATPTGNSAWLQQLNKPVFYPPAWIFGPVWTALYTLMGISAYVIWRKGWQRYAVKSALRLFFLQLILNASWTLVFFGRESIAGGVAVILLLWLALVFTIRAFARLSRPAAWLLAPYLLWVTFAAALNISIWFLN